MDQLALIHKIRVLIQTPATDIFFICWNYVDTSFVMLLISAVFWVVYRGDFGIRVFYIALTNSVINSAIKSIFMIPRPITVDPSLVLVHVSGYSFPSGAAQTAMWLPLLLGLHFRNKAVWIGGLCFLLVHSFSRIYLGAHYPTDILGGWIVGGLLLAILYKPSIKLAEILFSGDKKIQIALMVIIPGLLYLIARDQTSILCAIAALGAQVGIFINPKLANNKPPANSTEIFKRLVVVGAGFAAILLVFLVGPIAHALPKISSLMIAAFAATLWMSLGANATLSIINKNNGYRK